MTESAPDPARRAAAEVVARARALGLRLAVAESLTGGLLAAEIVSVPGASEAFSGGIVAYDTALKRSLLGVDGALLKASGPVDPAVARQMAAGARRACAVPDAAAPAARPADLGLSTTGVAGPDPDPQTGQPAGTVWIAVSSDCGDRSAPVPELRGKDRQEIRTRAVQAALELALSELDRLDALAGGQT